MDQTTLRPLRKSISSHRPIFDVLAWLFPPKRDAKNSGLHSKLSGVKMPTGVERDLSVRDACVFAGSVASHFLLPLCDSTHLGVEESRKFG